jgi:endonuclease/exonuclease/phosphatase family metal-dependent hydrolase
MRIMPGKMRAIAPPGAAIRRVLPLVLLALLVAMASPMAKERAALDTRPSFTTFTQNAYVGASIERVLAATTPEELVQAVTTTYYELLASRPNIRMMGIADRIADRRPDVVALQEMYLLRRQSPGDLMLGGTTPATEVVVDFLQSLMASLAMRGLHYRVAALSTETDVEMPMLNLLTGGIDDARLTDREVILVRTDLPASQFRVSNPQSGRYITHLSYNGVDILQGWCSVDVNVGTRRFRYINTHLQDESIPEIQYAQALELLGGPVATTLPVMVVGDLNADPHGLNGTWSYPDLIAAGLEDAWSALYPHRPGLTWGHDPRLADRSVDFVWRIDLVLSKGDLFVPKRLETVDTGLWRLLPPYWPSDHAGVAASFWIR